MKFNKFLEKLLDVTLVVITSMLLIILVYGVVGAIYNLLTGNV